MTFGSLMKVQSIADWSILQYFWPALSDNQSWKPIYDLFEWPLKDSFTVYNMKISCNVPMIYKILF